MVSAVSFLAYINCLVFDIMFRGCLKCWKAAAAEGGTGETSWEK